MKDYLLFRKMIAPSLLKLLFWPALMANIYYSVRLIVDGYKVGWVPLIVGSLFTRILFEALILFFSINETLYDLNQHLSEETDNGDSDEH